MWQLMLSAIHHRLHRRLGPAYHELSDESRRCLHTQLLWQELAPHLEAHCDNAPAVSGLKALEIELRGRVLTPAFLDALHADLADNAYSPTSARVLRGILRDVRDDGPTLGQAVVILRALAYVRHHAPDLLAASRAGRTLACLRHGSELIGWRFVENLQKAVERYRNPGAHGLLDGDAVTDCERLLLGEDGKGLLPFLLRATRPHHEHRAAAALPLASPQPEAATATAA